MVRVGILVLTVVPKLSDVRVDAVYMYSMKWLRDTTPPTDTVLEVKFSGERDSALQGSPLDRRYASNDLTSPTLDAALLEEQQLEKLSSTGVTLYHLLRT